MKLTKLEFKGIIKECIKELLNEGAFNETLKECVIGSKVYQETAGTHNNPPQKKIQTEAIARKIVGYGELIENDEEQPIQNIRSNPHLQNLIENTANMMSKGNKDMASAYADIFADTALNTLPKMMAQESLSNGNVSMATAAGQNNLNEEKVAPQQLQELANANNGDIGHWAKIAFGGRKP